MRNIILIAALLASGCSSSPGLDERVADYRSAATSLNAAIDGHAADPAAIAPATCLGRMTGYQLKASALIARMQGMSSGMDQCMSSMGWASDVGFKPGCAAMGEELAAHVQRGCSAADPGAEMARHSAAMKALTGQELGGLDKLGGMMGGAQMMNMPGDCY